MPISTLSSIFIQIDSKTERISITPLNENRKNNLKYSDTWLPTTPIEIDGDAIGVDAHNWTWAEKQTWCTKKNGIYLIENLSINAIGSYFGIFIRDSDVHFIIKNCIVYNTNAGGAGLAAYKSQDGEFHNNYCFNNYGLGIIIDNCDNISVLDNEVYDNEASGIYFDETINSKILRNVIYDNYNGIGLIYSNNNKILENTVINNENIGIILSASGDLSEIKNCDNNIILNNTIKENGDHGIYLLASGTDSAEVYCNNNIVLNNTIEANEDYGIYLKAESEVLAKAYCYNNTISYNKIYNNQDYGIYLKAVGEDLAKSLCNNNTIFSNNICENKYYGIYLRIELYDNAEVYCEYNNITMNTIKNQGQIGIFLYEVSKTILSSNNLINCGIIIGSELIEKLVSHIIDLDNKINNRNFYYYTNKINLGKENFTNAGQIILVNCNHTKISNLNLSHSSVGVIILFGTNNTIFNVTCSYGYVGIGIGWSDKNNITGNIANNNMYGIYLHHSNYNYIIGNNLIGNDQCIYEDTCEGNIKKNNICLNDEDSDDGDDDDDNGNDKDKEEIISGYPLHLIIFLLVACVSSVLIIIIKKQLKIKI